MSDVDDFERLAKRAGWGKAVVVGLLSAAMSIAGTTWAARGMLDDLKHDLDLLRVDLRYLREHADGIEKTAIAAKESGDKAQLMIYALKGGYPPGLGVKP